MKRIIALLLVAIMSISLVGCGSSKEKAETETDNLESSTDNSTDDTTEASTDASQESATEEITTVKLSYPVLVVVPSKEGTKQVEDAINKYLEGKGENVRIILDPIDGTNYTTTVDMAMTGGEDMDLFCPLTGLGNAVASQQVVSLQPYLDNELADTVTLIGEDMLKATSYNNEVYAVPCYKGYILNNFFIYRKDIFEELGFKKENIKTIKDVEAVLMAVKKAYPDMYPFAPTGGSNGSGNTLRIDECLACTNGYSVSSLGSGMALIGTDMKVQNKYATDYFKETCELAYRWNQEGLIMQDASFTTELGKDLINSGRAFSVITAYGNTEESTAYNYSSQSDYEIDAINLATPILTSSSMSVCWSIAYNSKNPAAAAKMLNLLFNDKELINLVIYGIEGVTYNKNEDGSISYLDGMDMNTVPYTAQISCGIVGNMFNMYQMDVAKPQDLEFQLQSNKAAVLSPAFGYSIDYNNIKTQYSAISNVEKQYLYGLICGELDPAKYLPEFNAALETAGINDVITEVQSQLDAWSKNK